MKKSVFSVASFFAYVGGLVASKANIGAIFQDGIVYLLKKLNLPTGNIADYQVAFDSSILAIFLIIGIRFYWHALHIDNNEEFFTHVEKADNGKGRVPDFILRTIWIMIALFFPIVCANKLFGGNIYTIMGLFVMFSMMYCSMYIWSHFYLDILLENSKSLTKKNKFMITWFDSIAFVLFFALPLFSWILIYLGFEREILYVAFFVSSVATAAFTIFQLIFFVPAYIKNNLYSKA